jgi:hypothetical protein
LRFIIRRQDDKLTVSISSSGRRGIILEAQGNHVTQNRVTEVDVENFKKAQRGLQQHGRPRADVQNRYEASTLQFDIADEYNTLANSIRVPGETVDVAIAARIIDTIKDVDLAREIIRQSPEFQRLAVDPDAQKAYEDKVVSRGMDIAFQYPEKIQQIQPTGGIIPQPPAIERQPTAQPPTYTSIYPSPVSANKYQELFNRCERNAGFRPTIAEFVATCWRQTGSKDKAAAYAAASPEAQALPPGFERDAFVGKILELANQVNIETNRRPITQ